MMAGNRSSGRRPHPSALHALRGYPNKDRAKRAKEPRPAPASATLEPPEHLNSDALAEWSRVVPELIRLGILGTVDRAMLAAYCVCWSRWVAAERAIAQSGTVVRTPNGALQISPVVSIASRALEQMRAFAAELGLTPAARTRLGTEAPPPPRDEENPADGVSLESFLDLDPRRRLN